MASLRLLAAAQAEYEEALAWYFARSARAAAGFEQAVEHGLRQIADTPLQSSPLDGRDRCYILRHYPYLLVYRVEDDGVLVVAVAHTRRRPGYWKRRR